MLRTLCLLLPAISVAAQVPAELVPAELGPQRDFVQSVCFDCHGGDATKGKFDLGAAPANAAATLWQWSRMRDRVLAGEMPPPGAEPPTPEQRTAFVAWADTTLHTGVPKLTPDPGRVTVRRLSRTQWENCVRDLFGVAVSTAAFPIDDLGYGFDTIGDALSFSTLHLEKYLAAAGEVAAAVFDGEVPGKPVVRRFEAELMHLTDGQTGSGDGEVVSLITRGTLEQSLRLPRDGVYRVRMFAGSDPAGDEPAKMALQLDGRELDTFEVPDRALAPFELTAPMLAGEHRLALSFLNDFYAPNHPDPARRDRNLHLDWCEVTGPLDARPQLAEQQWLREAMPSSGTDAAKVRAVVRAMLPRIWRRAATDAEVDRLGSLADAALQQGEPLDGALRVVLQAALTSPHFLFRIEARSLRDGPPGAVAQLSGPDLACRLAFFLWSSTPDAALLELGQRDTLGKPEVLASEVQRLLADPRSESLATDFAAQWFELRSLGDRMPDPARFPGFDEGLRSSLRRETELLFLAVLREQRDVRELLDCDFTHVDARLATFYELPFAGPAEAFQRIVLPASHRERGGVLGHGSVLAITANPTRTSPVKRGRWILDNLLGQPPPPPPPGNDSFANEAAIDSSKTFREQLAMHRERTECAVCHVRMDTLGFALERYDGIGRHRTSDAGGPIDCSGDLPGGRHLDGIGDLKTLLQADPAFVRVAAKKLFIYALGRDPRPIDRLKLDFAVNELLARGKVTVADLVMVIVQSEAFRMRTCGDRHE